MLDGVRFAIKTISGPIKIRNIKDPNKARNEARKISKKFIEKILPKFGIDFELKFGEETIKKYPEIVESIKKYIKTGELSDNLPLLWLGNHQAFGLEAIGAYYYFPSNGRIVLKDDLLKPPFFGKGIKAIEPIVYYRGEKNAEIKRDIQIKDNILNKKAVLVYPEGTRSKDGRIRGFDYKKYKAGYEVISNVFNEINTKVAIITSDTFDVLPETLEKTILGMGEVNPGKISYTIDIIDSSLYENIRNFNQDVKKILENNLKKAN